MTFLVFIWHVYSQLTGSTIPGGRRAVQRPTAEINLCWEWSGPGGRAAPCSTCHFPATPHSQPQLGHQDKISVNRTPHTNKSTHYSLYYCWLSTLPGHTKATAWLIVMDVRALSRLNCFLFACLSLLEWMEGRTEWACLCCRPRRRRKWGTINSQEEVRLWISHCDTL